MTIPLWSIPLILVGNIIGGMLYRHFKEKRTPKEPEPLNVAEFKKHKRAMQYLRKNQTTLGVYGGSQDLESVQNAIYYFAALSSKHLKVESITANFVVNGETVYTYMVPDPPPKLLKAPTGLRTLTYDTFELQSWGGNEAWYKPLEIISNEAREDNK